MKRFSCYVLIGVMAVIMGCATVSQKVAPVEAPVSEMEQVQAQKAVQIPLNKHYKRKIAIARFTNETNYGKALMTDEQFDRIGKQASDMLATKLIKSEQFLVFERPDLSKIEKEQKITGDSNLIGVDAVIMGSVSEFGRSIGGKSGFLSSTKVQVAKAKVDVRLVDVKTGQAFFSAIGAGEANTETGEIAGYGSYADYDATLNDRAISAAISDVVDKLVSALEDRHWRTDILEVQGSNMFISGGQRQGLKVGDVLDVMEEGAPLKSKQTGFTINLPAKKIATVKVVSFFGDSENNEGSVCAVITGNMDKTLIKNTFVQEVNNENK